MPGRRSGSLVSINTLVPVADLHAREDHKPVHVTARRRGIVSDFGRFSDNALQDRWAPAHNEATERSLYALIDRIVLAIFGTIGGAIRAAVGGKLRHIIAARSMLSLLVGGPDRQN
jgi:hypothetical protein